MSLAKRWSKISTWIYSSLLAIWVTINPRLQWRNPLLFVVFIGALLATVLTSYNWFLGVDQLFEWQLTFCLWLTLLFSAFAECLAARRALTQLPRLKRSKEEWSVQRLNDNQQEESVLTSSLQPGDRILLRANEMIPADGEVLFGMASIDESAILGESAPVIRESEGDRNAVTEGTTILTGQIVMQVTAKPGQGLINAMFSYLEGRSYPKTANELLLGLLLSTFALLFLITVTALKFFIDFSSSAVEENMTPLLLIVLYVCLIPIPIASVWNAIRIAGMDRIFRLNVVTNSLRAIEAAADVDLLIIDKTGTLTLGNRIASAFIPVSGVSEEELGEVSQLASLSEDTPEGRSIVLLAREKYGQRSEWKSETMRFIAFSPQTRMSGVDLLEENGQTVRMLRKGAVDSVKRHVETMGGKFPQALQPIIDQIALHLGGTPLLVSEQERILGVIYLKDMIKGGVTERFAELRHMGVRTLMVTADNALIAATTAAEAGIDDFMAEATPEMKLARIRAEQKEGHLVAMTGDGVSDAPALAQADVGVAMNTGTQASRSAGNMVDLDNNPTKLLEILTLGKQLVMTRGCLVLLSLASDLGKYVALLPALLGGLYQNSLGKPTPLATLNILQLHSRETAILSTLIFNAFVILFFIPLALHGVRIKPVSASQIFVRHLLLYGCGGLVLPFVAIKGIDLFLTFVGVGR